MTDIRSSLKKPFWAADGDLPGWDFCREIVKPTLTNEMFPRGVLGLRVDDDFWAVAALPVKYIDWKLKDIVANLWPRALMATFHPDSGTIEQDVERLKVQVYSLSSENKGLYSQIRRLEKEVRRHTYPASRGELGSPPKDDLDD